MWVKSHKFRVKKKYSDIETEEILLDSKRLKESPDSDRERLETPIKEKILKSFFICIVIILILLFIKTFDSQIIKGNYWKGLAEENRVRSYPIAAPRGTIYDKNKIPLATSVPEIDLLVIPADLVKNTDYTQIVGKLSEILEMPEQAIQEKIETNKNLLYPVIIADGLDNDKAILLEAEFLNSSAIKIEKKSRRYYEDSQVFSHILGYLGKVTKEELKDQKYYLDDYIGRTGIEQVYESQLRGEPGEDLTEINSLGKTQRVLATKEPIAGEDLMLSVDSGLQKTLYSALKSALKGLQTSRAAAVAINPQNGKILALASFPIYDNNNFIKGDKNYVEKVLSDTNWPMINRVFSGTYPSGSLIKPILASAGLEEKIVKPNQTIYCPGYINLFDKYGNIYHTYNDWKAHGTVSMVRAIAESCDVYFYTLGGGYGDIEGLGIEKIKKYLELFGWGEKTGIDFPNEKSGFVPDPDWKKQNKNQDWFIGDTYNVSIGQGDILATPLQLAMSISAIANNGKLFQPQLLENTESELIREIPVKKENLEIVRKGMREAVVNGTAKILNDLPVNACAKTGTAQVSKTKAPHAWFVAFAPYENPEIVVVVLIENGGEGSVVAAPVAKEALKYYFNK
jgi:penicillin-binding protein 2